MLLRLIDRPVDDGARVVDVVLTGATEQIMFTVDAFEGKGLQSSFRKALHWYFNDYPEELILSNSEGENISAKFISYGQDLGDKLLDNDDQIYKLIALIDQAASEDLHVRIESSDPEFFNHYWETLVLLDGKYVLSTLCASFLRCFSGQNEGRDWVELEYGLAVSPPPALDMLTGLPQSQAEDESANAPLKVLHVIFDSDVNNGQSRVFDACKSMAASEGCIDYEIFVVTAVSELKQRLSDVSESSPVHIVQLESQYFVEGGKIWVLGKSFEDSLAFDFEEFVRCLADVKVPLLCVSGSVSAEVSCEAPSLGGALVEMAKKALAQGIGNIVGLSESTKSWLSVECFKEFYLSLALGVDVGQAVIEARKKLQRRVEISEFCSEPRAFQAWPLLQHYGEQGLRFFEKPQAICEANTPQIVSHITKKMLGFDHALLSNEVQTYGQAPLISMLAQWQQQRRVFSIAGVAGIGKTHIAHQFSYYLMSTKKLDYSFYFDFEEYWYSSESMLSMIAQALDVESGNLDHVVGIIAERRCCFVFDGIAHASPGKEASDEVHHAERTSLCQLFNKLTAAGHTLIFTGASHYPLTDVEAFEYDIKPMMDKQQQQLTASCLRMHKLVGLEKENQWVKLQRIMQGNGYLIRNLVPLLKNQSLDTVVHSAEEAIPVPAKSSDIDFYEWQWSSMPTHWQKLLLLCAQVEGLIVEILMVGCDQKQAFLPAKAFFELLEIPDLQLEQGIKVWDDSGFLVSHEQGRVLCKKARAFLKVKLSDAAQSAVLTDELRLRFSQLLCNGIRILSMHLAKGQNTGLSYNLLFNRRHWVEHFERLWFSADYSGFVQVKNAFAKLMNEAKLGEELDAWSADLLLRTELFAACEDVGSEKQVAWLDTAIQALSQARFQESTLLEESVNRWQEWLESVDEDTASEHLVLYSRVLEFLQLYYERIQNWQDAITVAERADKLYTKHESWFRRIASLKALVRYNTLIGAKVEALDYENKILYDIPYQNSPKGFEAQQILAVIMMRVERGEAQWAQKLLSEFQQREDAQIYQETFAWLQADIFLINKDHESAMRTYCALWEKALTTDQRQQILLLKRQFSAIESEIGLSQFDNYFSLHGRDELPHPRHHDDASANVL